MNTQTELLSAADLWEISHLPDNAGRRFELINGELLEMSPAGGEHGGIAAAILAYVWNFVIPRRLGYVTTAETGYSLTGDGLNVVAPDVGFVSMTRLEKLPPGYIPLVPDLAVEVISPNDRAGDVQKKVLKYLEVETPLLWLVYPESRTVVVHANRQVTTLGVDDTLDGGTILPEFTLAVHDIFAPLGK